MWRQACISQLWLPACSLLSQWLSDLSPRLPVLSWPLQWLQMRRLPRLGLSWQPSRQALLCHPALWRVQHPHLGLQLAPTSHVMSWRPRPCQ